MSATTTSQNDHTLLTRFLREGCESAFGQLVEMHQTMVLGTALRRTGELETARDVTQQVFALLARKAAWLAGRESITGWLHHAAGFLAARAVRCEARARTRHSELAKVSEERVPETERWAELEDALAALSEKDREALLLHYFEDRSYPEMAAQLGLGEAAVRKRVSRAMQSLGERLRQRGIAVPSTALIAGAVALQTSAPAQAGLAAAALSVGSTSAPTLLTFTTVMSNTAAKIAAAAIILSTVPAALTYQQNVQLRAETAPVSSTDSEPPKAGAVAYGKSDLAGLNRETVAVWNQLAAEQTRRKLAEEKIADLTKQIERVENEVVISFGQVEDLARRLVSTTRTAKEFEDRRDKADIAERAKLGQEFGAKMGGSIADMFAIVGELRKVESDPDKAGRFYATLIGELGELDSAQRDTLAKIASNRLASMRQFGLTVPQRPPKEDPAWIKARRRAFTDFEDALLAALPAEKRNRELYFDGVIDFAAGDWMSSGPEQKERK